MSEAEKLNRTEKSKCQKVDPWFDIVATEHEILDFWERTHAFEKLREKNKGNQTFSFLDGPITANNPMGVHHAWGRTYKDVYQRFWAMNGRDERYQNGFDCQGLWVEVEVEKEHGFTSKREIREFGIDRFVEECKARVRKFSEIQTQQSVRLGMWMDWDNSYYTMANENNYTIWTFLKKCHKRGKVYRGTDVMPWSGRSGCAYSQMEIIEGRKLVAHPALFVRFPIRGREKENLLVWTTTPWTLTSNVAVAVNTDLDYVRLRSKQDGEIYYFAAENLEYQRLEKEFREKKEWVDGVPKLKTIAQIFNERGGFEIDDTVKGAQLVGLEYDGPFDELEAQNMPGGFPLLDTDVTVSAKHAHSVIDGGRDNQGNPVVVAGEGTGLVHIAPGCGDIDHKIGKELGLPLIAPLDEEANFLAPFGFLTGKNAVRAETRNEIIENLKGKGLLVATEQYPHVYPHCWRTGEELVFRLVEEWYINMDWRNEIKQVVQQINWIPGWGRDRELEWLDNMSDWMISKKRFWGLALPIWVCEKCNGFEVIGGFEELKTRAIEGWDDFEGHSPHRPWVDAVKIQCSDCGGKAHRIEDVGNPWLDAGIVPYSTTCYNQDRDYWKKWIPADLVLECFPGQFRNWFYSLLAMSTMMEGIPPFKNLKGHASVRDEKGEEMHKSKGNAIWFDDAAEKAGADVMRWLFVHHDPASNLSFGYSGLREIRGKFINTFWNTYAFLVNYARIAGFEGTEEPVAFERRSQFDRWILTELQRTVQRSRQGLESLDVRRSVRAIEAFVEKLSNWYIRHTRARFWKSLEKEDTRAAFETLYECLQKLIHLCAPMIPFVTEKMYQNLVRGLRPEAPESLFLSEYPQVNEDTMDEKVAEQMNAIIRINALALSARESAKIKLRQPLAELEIGPGDELEKQACEEFADLLRDGLNVKKLVVHEVGKNSPMALEIKPNPKFLGPRFGKKMGALQSAIVEQSAAVAKSLRQGKETFDVDVNGTPYVLKKEELIVKEVPLEGKVIGQEGQTWACFDIVVTEGLRREGMMRDLLRKVQVLRKDTGLEIEDRIVLRWDTDSEILETVVTEFGEFLADEVLAVRMTREKGLRESSAIQIGNEKISVAIEKAE